MSSTHRIVEGLHEIHAAYRYRGEYSGIFAAIYERVRANWIRYREPDRFPSPANWVLRLAERYTPDPSRRLEKQLQKQIAICMAPMGWGNDIPTASGLIDSRARQMNVDLGRRTAHGYELIEVKVASDTPYDAAMQVLRYGAIYMLYRLEPELACHTRNAMTTAKEIALHVLAPHEYYLCSDVPLAGLEEQLDREVREFSNSGAADVELSFRYLALPPDFTYRPGMDCGELKDAVLRRGSPFEPAPQPVACALEITGPGGQALRNFEDWAAHALPEDRRVKHWKKGRSAYELGWAWMCTGAPAVPVDLAALLNSYPGTAGTTIESAATEHETSLPFGDRGPRCHDLMLRGRRDDLRVTICVEAKADEPFGRIVKDELEAAKRRTGTRFPERLNWLTQALLGLPGESPAVAGLPYQMFTAVAGTLLEAEAQQAEMAILLIHEFRTELTTDEKIAANSNALNAFLSAFYPANGGPEQPVSLNPGEILGPITLDARYVAPALPADIPLFIAKLRTTR